MTSVNISALRFASRDRSFDLDLTYYLAGPMSGIPKYNYPEFSSCAAILRAEGVKIVSPHEVPWPQDHNDMSEVLLWEYMMEKTGELLATAGGVILMEGWPHSRGCGVELDSPRSKKQPVWFLDKAAYRLVRMTRE